MSDRPRFRPVAWILLAVIAAVAWWALKERASPGPLHPSHADVAALQGGAGCAACHIDDDFASQARMAEGCNACHTLIKDQLDAKKGIHGSLDPALANTCADCHKEHIGDTLPLVPVIAFERAGVGPPELYEHEHVGGLKLTGKHTELECSDCHPNAQNLLLMEGQRRFLGLTQQCTGCHNDIHKGELGNDCAKCHGQERPFKEVPAFQHPKSFPLVDGHARRRCSECHETPGQYKVANFKGLEGSCAMCHTDDYERTSRPAHKVARLGTDCATCHGTVKWTPARFEHPAKFALIGAHAKRSCNDCHAAGARQAEVAAFAKAEAARKGSGCVACHQDDFDRTSKPAHKVAGLGTDCVSCHGVERWTPATYTHDARFPLVGPHATVACATCHSAGEAQQKVLAFDASHSCVACHASPHDEKLVAAVARTRGAKADACVVCHAPDARSWREADAGMTVEMHALTGFELKPPHDAQTCAQCHAGLVKSTVLVTDRRPAAEWKSMFPGRAADDCEACHKDPHGGQFKRKGAAEGACLHCHLPTRFAPTKFDLTMHATCAFPIDGSHRAVACASCHTMVEGVRQFVGTKSDCASCHKDVHNGSFDAAGRPATVNGKTGCARCHTTERFSEITWSAADHALWTNETLTGKHATASCNDCHRREKPRARTAVPLKAVPFKPAPKECIACHDDVHLGQFAPAPNAPTDCTRCHRTNETFKTVTFDHQKDSRFPLDADHAKLECTACHKPVDVGGRAVVRYKPLGTKCADCHDPRVLRERPRAEQNELPDARVPFGESVLRWRGGDL